MKKFYVSLVRDLIDYYLEFEADSERTVRQYLLREYFDAKHLVWKLPWCSVYEQIPDGVRVLGIIKAPNGPLYSYGQSGDN